MQLPLLPDHEAKLHIVNVASVPQRSPFRYPGGKTWLVPYVRRWIASRPQRCAEFIEPFGGGGIISLTVAFERLADHVTMVERDEDVAAVWETVLSDDACWLAERIRSFCLTTESLESELGRSPAAIRERAFQTILRNRTNRGGILATGAGRVKHGENGKGLHSRWYPKTLSDRILAIYDIRERLTFIQGDGLTFLWQNQDRPDALFFLDPPYTAAGKRAGTRLYTFHQLDHPDLFRIVSGLQGDFLMTYDDASAIREMAGLHGFDMTLVPMKSTHHTTMHELLIGRDLRWVRAAF